MSLTLGVIAALALLIGAYDFFRRARARSDIAPASELQKRFGLYAENRPVIKLNPDLVPPDLRHLIPLAEKWGVGDDIIRNDLIDRASGAEKRELHDALYEPYERITEWLGSDTSSPPSDEAAAFAYMREALDEMGYYILDEKRGVPPPSDN